MMLLLSRIHSLNLYATDGKIGKILDFYFGVSDWRIRFMLVDAGGWLQERLVFIPPNSVCQVDAEEGRIDLSIDKSHVEKSPPPETEEWFSADFERRFHEHYGLPHSWTLGAIGAEALKAAVPREMAHQNEELLRSEHGDFQWRRCDALRDYRIVAVDGEIGQVEDFLIDTQGWTIPLLVAKTRNWLPGRHVLIETDRVIETISWHHGEVRVNLTRDQVKSAPSNQHGDPIISRRVAEFKRNRSD